MNPLILNLITDNLDLFLPFYFVLFFSHFLCFFSLLFFLFTKSCPTLWCCGLQHTRLPYPPLSPGVCSISCPLSQWSYPTISSSTALFSFCLQPFQHQCLFQWVSFLHQVAKIFSISTSNEYSRLISFRIDWFDLLAVQGTLKNLLQQHNSGFGTEASLALRLPYGPTLSSGHDYWENHKFDYTDLCWQSHPFI